MSINDDIEFNFDYRNGTEAVKNPSGALLIDNHHVADTLQCGHCGAHWIVVKGSKKIRGWCQKCLKALCGKDECLKYHAPYEEKIIKQEEGFTFREGVYIKS